MIQYAIDFLSRRKLWYSLSALVLLLGLIFAITNNSRFGAPLNLGIDFTGGTVLQFKILDPQITTGEVREVVTKVVEKEPMVQKSTDGKFLMVRTEKLSDEKKEELLKELLSQFKLEKIGENEIGPAFGKELTLQALLGVLVGSLGILIYVSFRYQFIFALAAIIALFHDALITLAIFAIMRFEIDSSFVAAILTIIGYSVNDTIVIFDRIRENLKKFPRALKLKVINLSINQTLTRSINTSLTTELTILALLIFGGATIKNFMFALFVGIISGTYSSIFLASPLLVDFENLTKPAPPKQEPVSAEKPKKGEKEETAEEEEGEEPERKPEEKKQQTAAKKQKKKKKSKKQRRR